MTIDTTELLTRAREAVRGATEGPWEAYGPHVAALIESKTCGGCSGLLSPKHEPACYTHEVAEASPDDARFIADARTLVPALMAETERLRAVIERVRTVADHPARVLMAAGESGTVRPMTAVWPEDLHAALDRESEMTATDPGPAWSPTVDSWADHDVWGRVLVIRTDGPEDGEDILIASGDLGTAMWVDRASLSAPTPGRR